MYKALDLIQWAAFALSLLAAWLVASMRISANVTDDFGNVTALSG